MRLQRRRASGRPSPDPLSVLLQRAGAGDEDAFGAVYDALSSSVYGVVQRVLRDPSHTAELTQEVFVELWRLAPRYDDSKGSVRAWACTIAHRRAVDRVRSEQARRNREQVDARSTAPVPFDSTAHDVNRLMEIEQVRDALESLTDSQRESLLMAYYGGHTYREVAELLGVPEGTIKTRIRDGLTSLRRSIGAQR